jgi:hypothetical protein
MNSVLYITFLENELAKNNLIIDDIISKKYQENLIHILKDKKEYINFFYISLKLIKNKYVKLLRSRLTYLLGKPNITFKRKDFKTEIEYLEKLSQFYLKSKNIDKDFVYFISEYEPKDNQLRNQIEMFKYTNLEESSIIPSKNYIGYLEKLFIVNNLEDKLEDIQENMKQVFKDINIVNRMIEKFSVNKTNVDINEMKLEIESEFMLGNIDIKEKDFLSNFINFLSEIKTIPDKKTRTKILYNYTYDYVNEDINEIINYDNIVNIDGITALKKLQRSGYDDEYIELQKETIKDIQLMRGDEVRKTSDYLYIKTTDLLGNDDIWISLFEKINMFKVVADNNKIDFSDIFSKIFYNIVRDFILSLKHFKDNNINDYYQGNFYHIKDGNIKIHTYNYITDILVRIRTLISSEINRFQINFKRINFFLQSVELIISFLVDFKFSDEEDININMIDYILDEKLDFYWEEETKTKTVTKSRNISTALIEQIISVGSDIYSNLITIIKKKDISFYNTLYKISKKLEEHKKQYKKDDISDIELTGTFKKLLDNLNEEDKNFVLKNINLFSELIPDFNASDRRASEKGGDREEKLLSLLKFFIKSYRSGQEKIKSKILIETNNSIIDKKHLETIKDKEILESKNKLVKMMKDIVDGKFKFEGADIIVNDNKDVIQRIQEIDNIQVEYDISSNNEYLNEINKLENILEQNINYDGMINFNVKVIKQIFKVDINFNKFKNFIDSNKGKIISNCKKSLSALKIEEKIGLNIKIIIDNHIKYLSILYLLYFYNDKINFEDIKKLDFKRYDKTLVQPDLVYHDLSDNEKIIGKKIGSVDNEGFIKFKPENDENSIKSYTNFYNNNKVKNNEIQELYKYMNVIIKRGNYKGYVGEYRGRKFIDNSYNDDLIEYHTQRLNIFKNNLERFSIAGKDYSGIEILQAEKDLLKSYRSYRDLSQDYNYLYSIEEYNKIIKNRLKYLNDLQLNIDIEKDMIRNLRNKETLPQIIVNIRTGTKQSKNITLTLFDIIIKKDRTYKDIISEKRTSFKKLNIDITSFFKLFKYISYNVFFDNFNENLDFIKLFHNNYKFCIDLLNTQKDKIINMNLLYLKLKQKIKELKQKIDSGEDKNKITEYRKTISLINKRLVSSFKDFTKLEKEDNLIKHFKKDLKMENNSYIIKINNNELKKEIDEYKKIIKKLEKEKELNNKNVLNKILFKSIMNYKRVKKNKNTIHEKTIKRVNVLIPLLKSRNIIFDNGDLFVDPDSHIQDTDNQEDIKEVLMFQEGSDYIKNQTSIVALDENEEVPLGELMDEEEIYERQYADELREEMIEAGDFDVGITEKEEQEQKGIFEDETLITTHEELLRREEEERKSEEKRKDIKRYLRETKAKEIEKIKKEKGFELTQEEFEKDTELVDRFEDFF